MLYLHKQGKDKELEKFDWYDSSLEEAIKKSKKRFDLRYRMELGLPIDQSEFNHVNGKLQSLVKSI
jgi:hypothetical protein